MSIQGLHPIVSECRLLREALKYYEQCVAMLSSMSADEDQRLKYDEKLQGLDGYCDRSKSPRRMTAD